MREDNTLTWAIPYNNTSGQCLRGCSSSDRTEFASPLSASWHKTSKRSRHNHAWFAWPDWNLWLLIASTYACKNRYKSLDPTDNSVIYKNSKYENLHTTCLSQCANVNTSGGTETAHFRNDSCPSVFFQMLPQTAASGKGSCIIIKQVSIKHQQCHSLSLEELKNRRKTWDACL